MVEAANSEPCGKEAFESRQDEDGHHLARNRVHAEIWMEGLHEGRRKGQNVERRPGVLGGPERNVSQTAAMSRVVLRASTARAGTAFSRSFRKAADPWLACWRCSRGRHDGYNALDDENPASGEYFVLGLPWAKGN